MEAPKNIYVHVKGDKVTNTWNSIWIGVHDVEYTRTDAFIDKAIEWLQDNFLTFNEEDVKEFKEYMKEE